MEKTNAEAQLGLVSVQTDIAKEGLGEFKGIQTDFYNASHLTSTETYTGWAITDTDVALSRTTDSMSQSMSQMGISPTSGAA